MSPFRKYSSLGHHSQAWIISEFANLTKWKQILLFSSLSSFWLNTYSGIPFMEMFCIQPLKFSAVGLNKFLKPTQEPTPPTLTTPLPSICHPPTKGNGWLTFSPSTVRNNLKENVHNQSTWCESLGSGAIPVISKSHSCRMPLAIT